ncbi:MAG: exodeoxyribonuclease VII large subunit, partial [Alistipes sp.]|nr:exodeoxyribonuclease VII large subunit [Alistipes sp.]
SRTHAALLRLEQLRGTLRQQCGERFAREKMRLAQLSDRPAEAARELLVCRRLQTDRAAEIVAAHAPERLLKLGFALLHGGGRPLVSATQARRGDEVEIRMADGLLTATITDTKIWRKKS